MDEIAAGIKTDERGRTVASASQGEKKLDQACLPQPGDEMLRWTSPGRTPRKYIVERWPTG